MNRYRQQMNEKQRMEELSLSWNRGKNEQICTIKFQNFLGAMPPDPHTGRGYGAPPQASTPSALRRFAPPCLARGLRPLQRPSLCVVDILRYFRPWSLLFVSYLLMMRLRCFRLLLFLIEFRCFSDADLHFFEIFYVMTLLIHLFDCLFFVVHPRYNTLLCVLIYCHSWHMAKPVFCLYYV